MVDSLLSNSIKELLEEETIGFVLWEDEKNE